MTPSKSPESPKGPRPDSDQRQWWLDQPRNVNKVILVFVLVCIALLVADFFYHKHVHFAFEGFWGFYALAGFASYVFLIITAKLWRKVVKRREDYYD